MTIFARDDTSLAARWWWTVDRWTLAALAGLMFFGVILVLAATPAVALRIGLDGFALAERHFVALPAAALTMLGASLFSLRGVRRLATLGFAVSLALTLYTLVGAAEIKGATRWLSIVGVSLQPSEFLKPTLAVVTAWLLAVERGPRALPSTVAFALFAVALAALLRQPDFGMAAVIAATWLVQVFLAGLAMGWVTLLGAFGVAGVVGAYFVFPHVALRIDGFIDPQSVDNYQVDRSLEGFANGGLFGRGPGEGTVKLALPDAHSDFVFAVAGEEFGTFVCLVLVGLFAFVLLRGIARLLHENSPFVQLAAGGLLAGFGLQALVNMGSALNLMPPKGMTLPFISYGGSSLVATGLAMGMLLALTRRRAGAGDTP